MGYEGYLRRDDNRTLFELGKWSSSFENAIGNRPAIFTDAAELAERFHAEITKINTSDHWDRDYVTEIARRIVEWSGGFPIEVCSEDMACDLKYDAEPPWRVTGTRYLRSVETSESEERKP